MEKTEIKGIIFDNYSLKESIRKAKEYLNQPGVHLILCMSPELFKKEASAQQRECIANMNLCVCDENGLSFSRRFFSKWSKSRNLKTQDFIQLYIKYLAAMKCTVMIVTQSADELNNFRTYLLSIDEKLRIERECQCTGEMDLEQMYNDINDLVPDVIISALPLELQGTVMLQSKRVINTKVWLGLSWQQTMNGRKKKKI